MRILKNKDIKKEVQESRHDGPLLARKIKTALYGLVRTGPHAWSILFIYFIKLGEEHIICLTFFLYKKQQMICHLF